MSKPSFGDYVRARSYSYTSGKKTVDHSGAHYERSKDTHRPDSCNDDGPNATCTKCRSVWSRVY